LHAGGGTGSGWGYLNIVTAICGTPQRQVDIPWRPRSQVQGDRPDAPAINDPDGTDPVPSTPKTLWVSTP
jgi:hypothetical protein